MWITTRAVYDIETGRLIAREGYEYAGFLALACSSGGEISKTDEALQKAQAAMVTTLNQDYSTTFAEQQAVLAQQKAKLDYMVANPMGYSPEELHTATASINENTSRAAQRALGSAAAFAAAHGAADIGGGAIGEVAGQIGSAAAQAKAAQLGELGARNQEMKRQNLWQALSGLNQVGAEYGGAGGTAIGGSSGVAGSSISAGQGSLAAKQAGWQNFGAILGGISGLAQSATGFL